MPTVKDGPDTTGYSDTIPRNSSWTPTLRRIQQGLFSIREKKQYPDLEPSEPKQNLPTQKYEQEGQSFALTANLLPQSKVPESQDFRTRTRPQGPREAPTGFKLFQRSNSRKIPRVLDGQESTRLQEERRQLISRFSTNSYKAVPPENLVSTKSQGIEITATDSRTKIAYIPTHAAADFSKLNFSTQNQKAPTVRQHSKASSETNEDYSSDYQAFLESEMNSTRSFLSKPRAITPRSTQIMDGIMSNHQASVHRKSFYEDSVRSRPVSIAESFRDRIVEYIKPSRPGTLNSRTSLDEDGRSVTGSYKSSARTGNRWSRVGEPIRRSITRDGDEEGDEAARRSWFGRRGGNGEKRRSKVMPVSPGLKKYNAAVKSNNYWR